MKQRETLAREADQKLLEAFNRGACQRVFQGATFFTRRYTDQDWLTDCEQLRRELGVWHSSDFRSTEVCGAPGEVVCVDGAVTFNKGRCALETAWSLRGGAAKLLFLVIVHDGKELQIPPSRHRELFDPPSSLPAKNV